MKELLKLDASAIIQQVCCKEMCNYPVNPAEGTASAYIGSNNASDRIAVYYCEGSIVQNEASGAIVSKKVIDDLDALADDDNVKAVVIRINSGGGDAFASEDIWHAVAHLKTKKPVVVSMSGMAASGAYYMRAGASWIIA